MKAKFVFESLIDKTNKKEDIFNYSSIINNAWRDNIFNSKKFHNISFDLENNDCTKQKKTLYIPNNLRDNQPIKDEFQIQLCKAGGDWEWPVMYFKVQFTHNYFLNQPEYFKNPEYIWDLKKDYKGVPNGYVLIPPVEHGNKLVKTDKGWRAYTEEDFEKGNEPKITKEDEKKAWNWVISYIEDAVKKRYRKLD